MHLDRRLLRWGVFLIALGIVPLAVQLGWLDQAATVDAERLWPVSVVAIGVTVLVDRTRFSAIGTLVTSIMFGLLIGGVLSVGVGTLGCIGTGNQATAFPSGSGALVPLAKVDVTVDCGTATLTTVPGTEWTLSGSSDADRRPAVVASAESLFISNGRIAFPSFGAARSDWHLSLPTEPDLDLSLQMNAGDARLDLAGARLTGVSLTANAGSIKVDLSAAASIQALDATVNAGDVLVSLPAESEGASITVNAGHLGLCLPAGIGLRIDSSGALSSNNFASRGLMQDGDSWTSPELPTKGLQLYVQITANAGTIELNPAGGCE